MKKIKLNLKERLDQIKVWQEECKLLLMILGCVSAVGVFFVNLFHGKVATPDLKDVLGLSEGLKGLGTGGGGGGLGSPLSLPNLVQPLPVMHHHVPIFMYINLAVIVLLGVFAIYFGVVVLKKWRTKK